MRTVIGQDSILTEVELRMLRAMVEYIKETYTGAFALRPVALHIETGLPNRQTLYLAVGFNRTYTNRDESKYTCEHWLVLGTLPENFRYKTIPTRRDGPNSIFLRHWSHIGRAVASSFWVASNITLEQSATNPLGKHFMIQPFVNPDTPEPGARCVGCSFTPIEL